MVSEAASSADSRPPTMLARPPDSTYRLDLAAAPTYRLDLAAALTYRLDLAAALTVRGPTRGPGGDTASAA
jgi:hypothetical protein